jgi:hypothetical protein
MKLYDLPKDFEITEAAEDWSNGLLRLDVPRCGSAGRSCARTARMRRLLHLPALADYGRADSQADRPPHAPKWLEGYHIPTLPGTIEPDMAAMILGMMKISGNAVKPPAAATNKQISERRLD